MWVYRGKEIHSHEDLNSECTDIVYEITYRDGRKYIGKKTVASVRRLKPTKKQLAIRQNYVRKEMTQLPFLSYEGSHSKEEGLEIVTKEILYQCKGKTAATYIETGLLFIHDAVITDSYLNKNIGGKFFDNALEGLIE